MFHVLMSSCPHVLMSFSNQCLQDHGRPGRILLDGEVYKCSLVGQWSKSRHCMALPQFQTLWLRCDANSLESNLFFSEDKEVWCSMQLPSCPFSANNHLRWTIVQHPLCPSNRRLRHWMAHGPLEVLLSDPWLRGSGISRRIWDHYDHWHGNQCAKP